MKLLESIRDRVSGLLIGGNGIKLHLESSAQALREATSIAEDALIEAEATKIAKESLVDLELAIDDNGWRELTTQNNWNFSRDGLRKMIKLSRLMYLINPLIKRAVTVQELYVWGNGCTVKAESEVVDDVIQSFLTDPKNQGVIGESWPEREREQRIDGNTFFLIFCNKFTGACRIRLLPSDQVADIIYNPEDSKETWFYKRSSYISRSPITGEDESYPDRYYPDINYNPRVKLFAGPDRIPIEWGYGSIIVKVLHVKTGGLSVMKFGMPELYSAMNWATAYKKLLENFATIVAAYARVALKITGNLNKKKVAASKTKLETAASATGNTLDNNPPTNTASVFLASGGADISAVKTAHSTTGPEEARALRTMVAAGTDTPEHFFGDSDVGNLATSATLDRPTELKMVGRQNMWAYVITQILNYVILWSSIAPEGKLRAAGYRVQVSSDPFDGSVVTTVLPPDGESTEYDVTFPSILERDVVDRVRAVVQAVTLGGSAAEGIIPDRKLVAEWLIKALGEKDVEGIVELLYPNSVKQGFIDPADKLKLDEMEAQGKKDLGKAALKAADNKAKVSAPAVSTQTA